MKILIDADACPVIAQAVKLAKKHNTEIFIIADTSHEFGQYGAKVITVDKGSDSADYKIANFCENDDIVITQDYGLAAMCLSRQAKVINQDGKIYSDENINGLLFSRYNSSKLRKSGIRQKGPKPRTPQQNIAFCASLENLIHNIKLS